jgi:carboxymethylenebutenolidase
MRSKGVDTQAVDITTIDGVCDAYVARPDDDRPHPGVLFFPDGIGIRPRLHEMADRIAAQGYVVLLPNVFYRSGRAPIIPNLAELQATGDRAKLMAAIWPIASSLTPASALRDTRSYLEYLATLAPGPVGVTGYCMGAGLALRTAGTYPERVAAAGGFHGGNLASDSPDSPHLLAGQVSAELYFGHADDDPSLPPEQIERLAHALDKAGVRYRAEVYPGATHGYTMSDTSVYNQEAEQRHWNALFDLFSRNLPTSPQWTVA